MILPVKVEIEIYKTKCDGCGCERDGFSFDRDAAVRGAEFSGWLSCAGDGTGEVYCEYCLARMAKEVP